MEKVAIIFNPNAGDGELKDLIKPITDKIQKAGHQVDVHQMDKSVPLSSIIKDVSGWADLIIGLGGDGTVHALTNSLCTLKTRPTFAIIPGGTCNDFSRALGINQDPMQAVDQILEGKVTYIDVGVSDQTYFTNFWGIGLITQVSAEVSSENKERLGRLAYYIRSIQQLDDIRYFQFNIESDRNSYIGEAALIIVGNGPFTGGVKAFFPGTNIQDGLLDVLVIKRPSFEAIWTMLRSKIDAQELQHHHQKDGDVIYFQTEELTISTSPEQRIDCDGERLFYTPSKLTVLPQHLKMVVGNWP